ncbi:MAG: hypothetical protein EGR90_13025 [Lachnospiraceae bacterium]|nr:hypothetical protein [Lachnospiraceae bacterium]
MEKLCYNVVGVLHRQQNGMPDGTRQRSNGMLGVLCIILAVCIIVGLWIMLYDTHHFVTRRYRFASAKIKKNTKIVMLSDLHNCRYGADNAQLFAAIEAEKPDLVILAGDMITASNREKTVHTVRFIEKLKSCYPLYYTYGNHEQKIILKEEYKKTAERFEKERTEAGISFFNNCHSTLADRGISLYGLVLDHSYFQRFHTREMPEGYMDSLLGRPTEDTYNILIAHNPDYFPEYAEWGAELVLSGHIHGGIIRVPHLGGFISPAIRFFPKYDGGLFKEKGASMVLGRGIGTHAPRVRLFNPGELIVVELTAQE